MVGTTKNRHFDLIVIGSGLAGSQASLIASKRGLKVGLVEEAELGGDSLNYSDLPLKQLALTARQFYKIKHQLAPLGINSGLASFNYPTITNRIRQTITKAGVANLELYHQHQIELLGGRAYFINPQRISVNQTHFTADKFIIATGASWVMPTIPGLAHDQVYSPRQLLDFYQLPQRLLIIGGHPTAIVLSQILASLGVKIHLICPDSQLLPDFSPAINQVLMQTLVKYFDVTVSTNSQVLEVAPRHQVKQILFSHAGIQRQFEVDEIIIAQQLQPNLDYGLNNASVDFTTKGIVTDHHLRTSNKRIFGAGDVLGVSNNPNIAIAEAEIATLNAIGRPTRSIDQLVKPGIIEAVINLARVGRNSIEGDNYRTASTSFSETPRQLIEPVTQPGLLTITIDQHHRLVGAECFGPEADVIIQQLTPLVKQGANVRQLLNLATSFLSWQEIINLTANKLL